MLTNFNKFRDLCHSTSVTCGWWKDAERYAVPDLDGAHDPVDDDRLNIPTKIALIHTEIREAHDFYLSGEYDDHLPHLLGAPVELGDTVIRVGDTAGYLSIDMDAAIAEMSGEFRTHAEFIEFRMQANPKYWRTLTGGRAILELHNFAADATEAFRRGKTEEFARCLARIVLLCDLICERNDWDLIAISREKVAYNRTRADHKLQAREADGGKII